MQWISNTVNTASQYRLKKAVKSMKKCCASAEVDAVLLKIHKECRISGNIQSPDYDFLLRLHKDSDIINKAAQAKSLR